jgi:hypothetical protein
MMIQRIPVIAARVFLFAFGLTALCWLTSVLLHALGPWGSACPMMW